MNIEHPAFHEAIQRGKPTKTNVGDRTVPVDIDDGTFAVENEAEAAAVMDRFERTYSVEYNDDGTIANANAPPASVGRDGGNDDTDETETEFDVLDGTVEEIEDALSAGEYDTVLDELARAEQNGEERAGVDDAIEERRETIEA